MRDMRKRARAIFRAYGETLFEHDCVRFGCAYISARPRDPDEEELAGGALLVPLCGCQP